MQKKTICLTQKMYSNFNLKLFKFDLYRCSNQRLIYWVTYSALYNASVLPWQMMWKFMYTRFIVFCVISTSVLQFQCAGHNHLVSDEITKWCQLNKLALLTIGFWYILTKYVWRSACNHVNKRKLIFLSIKAEREITIPKLMTMQV